MGTDINFHVEVFRGDKWEHEPSICYDTRSSPLFARLQQLEKATGIPNDVSPFVEGVLESYGDNGFYYACVGLADLQQQDWSDIGDFDKTVEALADLGSPQYVRVIFWFDN